MTVFPLLADPQNYVACQWDLRPEPQLRAYWLGLFRSHFGSLLTEAELEAADRGEPVAQTRGKCERAEHQFMAYLDKIERDPESAGARLDILTICLAREDALRAAEIDDPYRLAKHTQNEAALEVLPSLLRELDAMAADQRTDRLVRGIFAGNIFDMGATRTNELFKAGGKVDFRDTLGKLKERPWAHDDLDAFVARFIGGPAYKRALLFVDNAGPDVLLGMMPLARELLLRGTSVLLTANASPALNDVTIDELSGLVRRIAGWDRPMADAFHDGRLALVSSGNAAPLIDLTRISFDLANDVKANAVDLVVIEGMGRAVESNWQAKFTCDVIKVAMIKDWGVAHTMGWEVYDLVFKYEAGGEVKSKK